MAAGLLVAGVDGIDGVVELLVETLPEGLAGAVLVADPPARGASFEPEVHPAASAASSATAATTVLPIQQG